MTIRKLWVSPRSGQDKLQVRSGNEQDDAQVRPSNEYDGILEDHVRFVITTTVR